MNSGPTLAIGVTGADVRRLQIVLVMIKLLDDRQIDGDFGSKTQDAVKAFQASSNLVVDGIVGPITWNALPADPNTRKLQRGASGETVTALQKVCWLSAVPQVQPIQAPSTAISAPRPKRLCGLIKASTA